MPNSCSMSLILNIPLIVDEISLSLSKKELSTCTRVCSSWESAFAPSFWKDIQVNNHQVVSSLQSSPDARQGLIRNAQFVRTITSVFCYAFLTLSTIRPFENLTRLDSLASELHNKGIVDYTNTRMLLLFIERNPSLREISLTNFPLSNHSISQSFGNIIQSHPGLTSIYVTCFKNPSLSNIQYILQGVAMSKTVSSVSIICRFHNDTYRDPMQLLANEELNHLPLEQLPVGHVVPALEILFLDIILPNTVTGILLPLVKHCPNLRRLFIPNTRVDDSFTELCEALSQYCPKLQNIRGSLYNPSDQHLSTMLNSSRHLQSYSMKNTQSFGPLSIQTLTSARHCFTLQRLNLKLCQSIESKHILLILDSCPNLISFEALNIQDRGGNFDPRIDIKDLPIHSPTGSSWVCKGLQELQVGFSGFSSLPEGAHVQSFVDYIYDQLAALKSLRVLGIGGEVCTTPVFPANSPVWAFDFTLGSGLHKLEELKELRVLNIQRLKHHRIGQSEAEWMIQNWPRLSEFRAPNLSATSLGGNAGSCKNSNIPDYLQELTRHRPTLHVSFGSSQLGAR